MTEPDGRLRVVLEGLALIQAQERFGDEVYVLVTPIHAGVRGETVRHPGPKQYWKLKKSDKNIDPRIGPGVRPLQHPLAHAHFADGDQLELAFWDEDFAPIDPDDPLTIVTLHFQSDPNGQRIARLALSRKIPDTTETAWIRPPRPEPYGVAVGATRVVGKGGADYGAYFRLEKD